MTSASAMQPYLVNNSINQEKLPGLFMENSEVLCLATDNNDVVDLVNGGSGKNATPLSSQPSETSKCENSKKRLKRPRRAKTVAPTRKSRRLSLDLDHHH